MPLLDASGLENFFAQGKRSFHLIGVAGSGMCGLASILLEQGHRVSGSDLRKNNQVNELISQGLAFHQGHDKANVSNAELVVFSSAITDENPERVAAVEKKIPQARRAETLAAACRSKKLFVVAGTHGKTTSTTMLAHLLQVAGKNPSFYIGAEVPLLGSSSDWTDGTEMVVEADESDGSISAFSPDNSLILNIEAEHLDYYRNLEAIIDVFKSLGNRTKSSIVYCADDEQASEIFDPEPKAHSYGFADGADYKVEILEQKADVSRFKVVYKGQEIVTVTLHVPGRQNVSNATGVIALGHLMGVDAGVMVKAFESFRGARRRFDILYRTDNCMVVDDYAHHPSEIRETIRAARTMEFSRVVAVFQPHRYSRTQHLGEDLVQVLSEADEIFLTEVYASSEKPIEGVSSQKLVEKFVPEKKVTYCPNLVQLRNTVATSIKPGDLVLVMGAGSIGKVAEEISETFRIADGVRAKLGEGSVVRTFEPLAKHTTMRVGGPARVWCEPDGEESLSKLLKYAKEENTPVTVIGRGSNLLVLDGGIPGICIHLSHPNFSKIEVVDGKIHAGAGARLKQIVAEGKKAEIGGLEFMEGIPASLGGALRMNAGAMDGSTFQNVESIRVMDRDGIARDLPASEVEIRYRSVPLLKECIAISAVLAGRKTPREEISAKLKKYSEKRWSSQPAAPSAGCIFKNPEAVPAGKLIDELGLKGTGVGKARVSPVHGNFIVNEGHATAKDILRLVAQIKEAAKRERGIELETEVMILGENDE